MSYTVESVTEDAIEIWDGTSWMDPSHHNQGKSTLVLHGSWLLSGFQPGDKVNLVLRLDHRPELEDPVQAEISRAVASLAQHAPDLLAENVSAGDEPDVCVCTNPQCRRTSFHHIPSECSIYTEKELIEMPSERLEPSLFASHQVLKRGDGRTHPPGNGYVAHTADVPLQEPVKNLTNIWVFRLEVDSTSAIDRLQSVLERELRFTVGKDNFRLAPLDD